MYGREEKRANKEKKSLGEKERGEVEKGVKGRI